jgi:hypothetical protein
VTSASAVIQPDSRSLPVLARRVLLRDGMTFPVNLRCRARSGGPPVVSRSHRPSGWSPSR